MTQSKWHEQAEKLVRLLRQHCVGRLVDADYLMFYLNLDNDRDLRSVVHYARMELGEPIISTFDGYSWPTGWDDDRYDHCVRQRRQVAAENLAVAAAIVRGMEKYFGQPTLFGGSFDER